VAIGNNAGYSGQSTGAVAIGSESGLNGQGDNAVAIGVNAGRTSQGQFAVAIGDNAGNNAQGTDAVAIGASAGLTTQGNRAVAIGISAGQTSQGINSIAIGQGAGETNQGNNSIILNATGAALDQTTANTFTVAPVRNDVANTAEVVFYNATSKEITYGNVISVAGNITGNYFNGNIQGTIGDILNVTSTNLTVTNISAPNPGNAVNIGAGGNNNLVVSNVLVQVQNVPLSVAGNVTGGNILTAGIVSATGNVSGNFFIGNGSQLTGIAASYGNANVATFLAAYGSNTVVTTGNITAGNLISSTGIVGNIELIMGNVANASATRTRILSDGAFSYIQTGNGTAGTTGNIVFSPYQSPTQQVVIDTASGNLTAAGNITAQNFTGNINITSNVQGTSANVDLVAGAYEWSFDNTGNLTLPGNTFSVNYANNTPVDIITRFEGSWNVGTGNTTQSFTVDGNNTYQMWVEGNIPNGIIAWNATVTVTNTNVPVLGQQFAWNYEGGGNILMFNSIPAQIIGTAGAISNAEPAVANTNVFSFGINNASGNVVDVRYGWIKIS
jgi:hypothetical protein